MQLDFHYYATYCAALLAGYTHEESLNIGYYSQFVDCCSKTLISKVKGPASAATTQRQMEMMNARTDILGLQDITRIWASFHFLPYDLYREVKKGSRLYKNKYRLICDTNSDLLVDTIRHAKGRGLEAAGMAMHVLADTWAHRYFAGTPSLVINNTNYYFYELYEAEGEERERSIRFVHNPTAPDDIEKGYYTNTVYQVDENAVMNLGHGRAGHLPDYSFIKYKYLPSWADYDEIVKDNPRDYYHAFAQMVYALKYLRGDFETFKKATYEFEAIKPYEQRVRAIIGKRQPDACADWRSFGEAISGEAVPDFDTSFCIDEYQLAPKELKDETGLGRFFIAAMSHKSMVTNQIFRSKNLLAGFSVDYKSAGFKGIRDFKRLIQDSVGGQNGQC